MRTRNDLKILRFSLICGVTLDMERVENDPAWVMASRHFDIEDPLQMDAALVEYLKHYLAKEVMLTEMPSTNGPADVYGLECTGPRLAEQQATEAREKLRAELLAADDAPVPDVKTLQAQLGVSDLAMKTLGNQISLSDPNRRVESIGQAQGVQAMISVVTRLNASPVQYLLWSEQ